MPASSRPARCSLREFAFIDTIHRRFGRASPSVIDGIGDDAAAVRPPAGSLLLLTTDLVAEGVHFDLRTATFEDVGYKVAVANLSDIAAMGGQPLHVLVSMAVPSRSRPSNLCELYRGIRLACKPHGVVLIGGDTSASSQGLFVNLTVTGRARTDRLLRRHGARVGDHLYVTGTLGDSLAGLQILSASRISTPAARRQQVPPAYRFLIRRHFRPTPRLEAGAWFAHHRMGTSAIFLSDGLGADLRHLCEQAKVGPEVDEAALALSQACRVDAKTAGLVPY